MQVLVTYSFTWNNTQNVPICFTEVLTWSWAYHSVFSQFTHILILLLLSLFHRVPKNLSLYMSVDIPSDWQTPFSCTKHASLVLLELDGFGWIRGLWHFSHLSHSPSLPQMVYGYPEKINTKYLKIFSNGSTYFPNLTQNLWLNLITWMMSFYVLLYQFIILSIGMGHASVYVYMYMYTKG